MAGGACCFSFACTARQSGRCSNFTHGVCVCVSPLCVVHVCLLISLLVVTRCPAHCAARPHIALLIAAACCSAHRAARGHARCYARLLIALLLCSLRCSLLGLCWSCLLIALLVCLLCCSFTHGVAHCSDFIPGRVWGFGALIVAALTVHVFTHPCCQQ